MSQPIVEANLDGMIGPSHHFGGLGVENKASEEHQYRESHPKLAALEGLSKMELIASFGVPQFYLPPPQRPAWSWLDSLGFTGAQGDVLKRLLDESPKLLSAAYSSSFMWTANAATFAAASETRSGQALLKVANLSANLHRSIETSERLEQLSTMFANLSNVRIMPALFGSGPLRDEGAANCMRLCSSDGQHGLYIFVYGEDESEKRPEVRRRKPRQTKLASELVARSLELSPDDVVFVRQTVDAIDAGVFHNDVIATSHESLLLYHQLAFDESTRVIESIEKRYRQKTNDELTVWEISGEELSLTEAVDTYFFNSQIVTNGDGNWVLVAPNQCKSSAQAQSVIRRLTSRVSRFKEVYYVSLDESMANGGGPACLRLRVSLRQDAWDSVPCSMRIGPETLAGLRRVVESEYPEKLSLIDLANREFAEHCQQISRQIDNLWRSNSVVGG